MPGASAGRDEPPTPTDLPRITFVVPTLNEARRIGPCLQSILAAEYPADRRDIIVIDTGSTDQTVALTRAVPGVLVVETRPERPTAAGGLNEGLARATGAYVQYVAADCQLDPAWPKRALAAFAADRTGSLAVVGGRTVEAKPYPSVFSYLLGVGLSAGGSVEGFVLHNAGTGLIRRDVLDRAGRFNPRLVSEDEVEFGIRVADAGGTFLKIPAPMVTHHLDLTSSISGLRSMLQRSWRLGLGWGQLRDLHPTNPRRLAYMRGNRRFLVLPVVLIAGIGLIAASFTSRTSFGALLVFLAAGFVLAGQSARQYRIGYLDAVALAVWYLVSSPWVVGGYLWYVLTKPVHLRPST